VAYVKFFANAKAAEAYAATEYVQEDGKTVVKAPLRPIDPTTVKPVILMEGEDLNVTGGSQMRDAAYDYGQGFITLTAKGADPNYFLYRESTKIAPFMAIKYRTTIRNVKGEIHAGSVQNTPNGRSDRLVLDYITDGEWHVAVIDLRKIPDYNPDTDTVNYLRFDFLHSDSGLSGGAYLEVEYIGFFNTVDEATVYPHTLPEERALHTITFVVNGIELYKVQFREGDASIQEPVVPILPGMVGAWEAYTLGTADITVNAVYTPTTESDIPDVPPLPSEGDTGVEEPETNVPVDPSTNTAPAGGKGCGSVLSVTLLPLLLAGAFVALRKREHRL
jgi:hypothetical protein